MKGKQKVKFALDEVRGFFEVRGYRLLETDYINATTKMRYECPNHKDKETYISVNDLKNNGRGCVYCAGLNKPTFDEVKERFNSMGYYLLETEYKNQSTKMRYKCRKHPEITQFAIYKTIKKGHGCKLCGRDSAAKSISGSNNWNWGGGVSELKHYLRKQIDDWKFKSLERHNFKCVVTGEKAQDLQVHHLIPFYIIRDEVLSELKIPIYETIGEYTDEQLSTLVAGMKRKHDEQLGVPLRYHIHRLFHHTYGNNATEADFIEFKTRYNLGEFAETLAN